LIKAVRAIASPNALPDFAANNSENVTFDALVDTSGQVKSMKPLSGSPALQSAAITALKQYQYEPATRHGKPIPAHVTVTVKFLFEP
jgi:TonB family protein